MVNVDRPVRFNSPHFILFAWVPNECSVTLKTVASIEETVCELETCYLSPAYKPMNEELANFLVDNDEYELGGKNPNFRGMVTKGEFPENFHVKDVVTYEQYVLLKAEAPEGLSQDDALKAQLDIALDLAKYCIIHWAIMGEQRPMPLVQPESLAGKLGKQSYLEFLEERGLIALIGALQYGYEIQGYGSLDKIPAYYGLIWITPEVTNIVLSNQIKKALGFEQAPVVLGWSKGWGDIWEQLVEKENLNIEFNVNTTRISREGAGRVL